MKETGKRLKKLRENMGLTQTKMAELFGLKQSSINKYEHGTATPTIENLRKFADFFDVSMDYLFARTDNPQGKLYENKPKRMENDKDIERFIEVCFDQESPYNLKLKQALIQLMGESKNE